MRVRVPGSSANLGPGFDALGVAIGVHLEVVVGGDDPAGEEHAAVVAFRRAGGRGPLAVRSELPAARGLGFSGAARVAGALAGASQRGLVGDEARRVAFDVARGLEGHDDNVAASLAGGVVVTAAGRVVGVPVAVEPAVVLWVPGQETVTAESRARLADPVPRDDAVFNLGRTALLVAALATGRVEALRDACADRLHQEARLRAVPGADEAIRAALEAGAWSAWLSGSGPSVAAFVEPGREDEVVAALPEGGVPRVTTVDPRGAVVDPTPGPGDGGEERLRDAR